MGDSKEGTFGQSGSTRFPQDHRTMAQASMITQMQIRNNATEMQSFLTDLHDWQDDIKVKDQKLKNGEVSDGPGFYELLDDSEDLLQDVNMEVLGEEELENHAKNTAEKFIKLQNGDNERIRPKTYQEYKQWDKFNVDDQLKMFDEEERQDAQKTKQVAAQERQRQKNEKRMAKRDEKQEAEALKAEGNDAFMDGKMDEALECYTLAIMSDPTLFSAYTNRSAVLHKLGRDADAETDADKAIELNKRFTKGYLRRGAAREGQGKLQEALKDFEHARTLEPCNKETSRQLRRVRQSLGLPVEEEEEEAEIVIPLTAVSVVDYNTDSDYDDDAPVSRPKKNVKQAATVDSTEKVPQPLLQPELHELPVPNSSTQFEHTWERVLCGNPSGRAEYLRAVNAQGFASLFQEGMESDLYSGLLETCASAMPAAEAYEFLLAVSRTDRFDMNVMMATAGDKQAVETIVEGLNDAGFTEKDCFMLKKRYGL